MATHKVKAGIVAQLWDKPASPRTNKGQLQAGTTVTVVTSISLDTTYYQLSSGFWSKAMWFEALPVTPPPDPNTIVLPEYFTAHDAVGNVLGFYDLRKTP